MEPLIKNLPHARPFPLKDQVGYEPGKVVSLTLAQRPGVGMTLFAFDARPSVPTPPPGTPWPPSWRAPLRSPLTVSRTR